MSRSPTTARPRRATGPTRRSSGRSQSRRAPQRSKRPIRPWAVAGPISSTPPTGRAPAIPPANGPLWTLPPTMKSTEAHGPGFDGVLLVLTGGPDPLGDSSTSPTCTPIAYFGNCGTYIGRALAPSTANCNKPEYFVTDLSVSDAGLKRTSSTSTTCPTPARAQSRSARTAIKAACTAAPTRGRARSRSSPRAEPDRGVKGRSDGRPRRETVGRAPRPVRPDMARDTTIQAADRQATSANSIAAIAAAATTPTAPATARLARAHSGTGAAVASPGQVGGAE